MHTTRGALSLQITLLAVEAFPPGRGARVFLRDPIQDPWFAAAGPGAFTVVDVAAGRQLNWEAQRTPRCPN